MDERDILDQIFGWLGLDGSSALALILLISMISNLLYRLIPDDAEGFLGQIKPILRVVGLYASNRISHGVTVNDVAKEAINAQTGAITRKTEEVAQRVDERIEDVVDQIEDRVGIDFGRAVESARRIVPPE